MEVRRGYKQTEVGLIPDDWGVKSLGQLGNPVRGASPRPAGDSRYFNGSFIPWLTVAALTNIPASQINVTETSGYLTYEGSLFSRTLNPGTLIIANSGATLGIAKILGIKCCANDGIAAILNISKDICATYLAHSINMKTTYLREVVATGNGQPNLNTNLIGGFKIPIPPTIKEQEAISKVLNDIDALIETLEKLIAKNNYLKQGAMNELLTGKKRLSGFSRKWETKKLGDIVKVEKGWLITQNTTVAGQIPVIAGGKEPAYFHNQANRYGKTITISGSGANAGYVSFFNIPIFASDCSTISEGPDYDLKFIYYVLLLNQDTIYKTQTGGAQPHVHPSDLKMLVITTPEMKKEQTAIAAILNDMDVEIKALEDEVGKYKSIKQGMMQQLLTGRIRLI